MNKFKIWDKTDRLFLGGTFDVTKMPVFLVPKNFVYLQCTGLTDKDGTEIFVGDIVEIGNKRGDVFFCDGAFMVRGIDLLWFGVKPNGVCRDYKVIGNIFENPELLNYEKPN